ncbi:DNA repair ATPase [Thalassotalea sp. G20_0]|uniref:P-loop ATPase, Sll1717 family n=1 Tax=Thalassotalea sp. G20_0 TaxID=2821093 RepID=UPI001ADB1A88|nr:P-loop NTPase fold protein [Thalassotalea sp. G20_0]MBO9497247.1 DNA repair ATPase [Thalassotalea sp. G20_0]
MLNNKIQITRNMKVGALDAETDYELLDKCFVDKGYLNELTDVSSPTSIVLGRTGSGKSALLYKVQQEVNKSVRLDPNDISVRFLEYSDIIQFFDALNVNLDLFYRLLWRHLLTVEFLKLRYDIKNEYDSNNFFKNLTNALSRDKTKKKALEYFREWGDKFWLDTDEHLKEITSKLEEDTKASVGVKFRGVSLSAEGIQRLSDQEKIEVKQRASQVVNSLQIRKLNEVLNLLSEHSFDDQQKKFYILIDQLDEDWANTETRCRFIRALIEEIKTFRKIKPVKIVAALRKDLLDLVFNKTRDSGFQEEKYESYILNIRWSSEELKQLIELRINEVFKSQYTGEFVQFEDLFPKARKNGGQTAIDFLLERTLRRPRDILQFVNECFYIASDRERISWRAMQAAEAQYSEKRLKSLKEEWGEMYPSFDETVEILRGLRATFTRSAINDTSLEDVMLPLYEKDNNDPCTIVVKKYYDGKGIKEVDVISAMLSCLYRVSAIGIKISSLDTFIWSYIDQSTVSKGEIKRANQIKIHKMLHRALDIVVDQKDVFSKEDID